MTPSLNRVPGGAVGAFALSSHAAPLTGLTPPPPRPAAASDRRSVRTERTWRRTPPCAGESGSRSGSERLRATASIRGLGERAEYRKSFPAPASVQTQARAGGGRTVKMLSSRTRERFGGRRRQVAASGRDCACLQDFARPGRIEPPRRLAPELRRRLGVTLEAVANPGATVGKPDERADRERAWIVAV
jgi:hypothetical protein